jgi:hypothetical protein
MNAADNTRPTATPGPGEPRTVVVMTKAMPDPTPQASPRSAFVPLTLATLALITTFGWQAMGQLADRNTLQAAHAGQQQTVDNAGKLRSSLDGLAADTQRLADGGNANAALLVAELKKRGITINAQAANAPAPVPK